MTLPYLFLQQSEPWHRQGLYMGMHWAWWFFWFGVFVVLAFAFWRLIEERRECQALARRMVEAEDILRQRFAEGEIDEEELLRGMRALHATRVPQSVASEAAAEDE